MKQEYLSKIDDVLKAQNTTTNGLTSEEAEKRLAAVGKNKLAEGKKETLLQKFLRELSDPMIIILIIAAVISGITAAYEGESFTDVFIILAVVIINAVLGVAQESKAEKAIAALQEIAGATSKVLRDGKQTVIRSEELVVGDIIVLEAGDAVPADARIIECGLRNSNAMTSWLQQTIQTVMVTNTVGISSPMTVTLKHSGLLIIL